MMFGKTLVIAPHLDDETIALGGTIKKIVTSSKLDIHVLIVGGHLPPLYKKEII
jgi:LmbE family N-acetylglucosaminyl deacetylase